MATADQTSAADTVEQLQTAIDILSDVCDGYGDRVDHGSTIISRLNESEDTHDDAAAIYNGDVEMDVLRFGMPAEDALDTLREDTEAEIGEPDPEVINQIVSELADYAAELDE
jgi:vacuolar-type H+-ATPase subunit B/Vma2